VEKSEGLLTKHNCPFSARITVRFEPAGCPLSTGIGVRFQQESLSALVRNWCPLCARTSVRFAQYFAGIEGEKDISQIKCLKLLNKQLIFYLISFQI